MPNTKSKKTSSSLMDKDLLLFALRLMTTAKTLAEKYEANEEIMK